MELISGQHFDRQHIALDGKHFIDCTLNECSLEYSGQKLTIERTEILGCSLTFRAEASRTLQFLQGLGYMPEIAAAWRNISDTLL